MHARHDRSARDIALALLQERAQIFGQVDRLYKERRRQ